MPRQLAGSTHERKDVHLKHAQNRLVDGLLHSLHLLFQLNTFITSLLNIDALKVVRGTLFPEESE